MSDKIIPFPGSPESAIRLEQKAKHERLQQERVSSVRAAAKDPKREFDRDNEIGPAQTIDKLIDDAKKQKITQRDIRKAHPKLHLERLRVDHELSPSEAKKEAANNLIRKVQPYVAVLDTLAEKLGRSAVEIISEAFSNTTFWQIALVSVDDPAAEFNWLLHEMSRYVVTSKQLDDYFRQASSIPERYDPVRGDFFPAVDQAGYFKEGYENMTDGWETQPSFPTVPLVRVHRETFSGLLLVEEKPVAPPDYPAAEAAALILKNQHPFRPTDTRDCEVSLFTDLRLVIGPLTRADDLGPLFETRSYVELKTDEQLRPLTFSLALYPLYALPDGEDPVGSVAARFDDGWRRIGGVTPEWTTIEGQGIAEWSAYPEFFGVNFNAGVRFEPLIGDHGGEEWAVCWYPVNASTVKQLMTLLSSPTPPEWLLRERVGPEATHEVFWFPGEYCQEFEQALYTGAIETELAADCDRLKTRLAECIEEFKKKRELEMETLLSRWRSPSDT
jgi:hypothetical protein